MTDKDRIDQLEQIVRAQSRLLAELFGMLREEELKGQPLQLTEDEGQEMLDMCLDELPPEMQNHWFGQLLGYFDHRRPV